MGRAMKKQEPKTAAKQRSKKWCFELKESEKKSLKINTVEFASKCPKIQRTKCRKTDDDNDMKRTGLIWVISHFWRIAPM